MGECQFVLGSSVIWSPCAPKAWRHIWTPGPMTVVGARFNDGTTSEYLMQFIVMFGQGSSSPPFVPGWLILVEYDANSTSYYNPPLSTLVCISRIQKKVHEKWLLAHTALNQSV